LIFCDLSQEWLRTVQPQIKESTNAKYRNLIQSYIIPEFGTAPISEMTADSISAHCNHLLMQGGVHQTGLSSKTVTDVISVVRRVLRYSQQKGIPTPCTGEGITAKQTPKELCVLSRSEQALLYHYLVGNPSSRNLGILICLLMGLRVGEICALKWEDVSFRDETIHVHQTMQRIQVDDNNSKKRTKVIISTPKSPCSIRTIPIPASVMSVIRQHYPNHSGYVLTGSNDAWVEPRTMQNHFKRVLSEIGIEPVNYHALRHTFATRCVEVGFDVKSLSEILGHANVNITMNRYVHPTMEMKKKNMQRLSDEFLVG